VLDKILERIGKSRDPDYTVNMTPDDPNNLPPEGDDSIHEATEGETGEGVKTEAM
jgi:hypothetical protein